jgi:rfaE bifunctional protein kinase chain/domain
MIELARRWRDRRVLVIGDVLLDRWLSGTPSRVSREAPVPVVELRTRHEACGGAANTAVNLAALGAAPIVVGAVGADPTGDRLRALLTDAGVDEALVRVSGRATVTKSRIMADEHILARVDEGDTGPVPADAVTRLRRLLDATLPGADAVMVCDYGAGTLAGGVREWLHAARDAIPFLVVDSHEPAGWRSLRPALVTPSYDELGPLVPAAAGAARAGAVEAAAVDILAGTGAAAAAVTLDEDGAVVLHRTGRSLADGRIMAHRTYARPEPPSHTAGAGDAYAAGFTLARIAGAAMEVAAEVAQRAAAVAIREPTTCVCSLDRMLAELPVPRTKAA